MIKTLRLTNFTVFKKAELQFSSELNVIIGENGTGKTHLLKLGYLLSNSWKKNNGNVNQYLSDRIRRVFKVDKIGSLTTSGGGVGESQVMVSCEPKDKSIFSRIGVYRISLNVFFSNRSKENIKSEASVDGAEDSIEFNAIQHSDDEKVFKKSIYIPSKEIISWFEGFIALYEKREVSFDETYKDLAINLALPKVKIIPPLLKNALDVLVADVGGTLELEGGKFYLVSKGSKRTEVNLVAEGVRKLATLLRLIENGSLAIGDTLFWDEPESNLNPKLLKDVAKTLFILSKSGVQVIIATHSYFLLKEFDLLSRADKDHPAVTYFCLSKSDDGVIIQQGDKFQALSAIVALDEELAQYDREQALYYQTQGD